jgi:hypothetical protein
LLSSSKRNDWFHDKAKVVYLFRGAKSKAGKKKAAVETEAIEGGTRLYIRLAS